jgi:hypothetical protein
VPLGFFKDGSWTHTPPSLGNNEDTGLNKDLDTGVPEPPTSTCHDVTMPITLESGLELKMGPEGLDNSERSRCAESEAENKPEPGSNSLNDFRAVHWADNGYGWHECAVCGYTKLSGWQAETFQGKQVWLCDDCKHDWEQQQEEAT